MMNEKLVSTGLELPGYEVIKTLGVILGISVRSRSLASNFLASLQLLFGGDITIFIQLCEVTRKDAYNRMVKNAVNLGANAIIGVRYDTTDVAPGVVECLCYGTAIIVEPR
ncbi:YbjQ family protein [Nostoc sp.]|uniref:YbjQ family protein n=1 Tax=Nostoc sp. TaxID=1180 RepID=UPI002FF74536